MIKIYKIFCLGLLITSQLISQDLELKWISPETVVEYYGAGPFSSRYSYEFHNTTTTIWVPDFVMIDSTSINIYDGEGSHELLFTFPISYENFWFIGFGNFRNSAFKDLVYIRSIGTDLFMDIVNTGSNEIFTINGNEGDFGLVRSGTLPNGSPVWISIAPHISFESWGNNGIQDIVFKRDDYVEVWGLNDSNSIDKAQNPIKYILNQNYPNPFNPSTTIDYIIGNSGNVKILIFNINGQLVESLIDNFKTPGSYSINWYPNNLSSGQYLYQIVVDGKPVSTKKAILLK